MMKIRVNERLGENRIKEKKQAHKRVKVTEYQDIFKNLADGHHVRWGINITFIKLIVI